MRADLVRTGLVRLFVSCALLGFAGAAWADWMRDYDRGVKAFEDGNWSEAESYMRSALADNPNSNDRQRFQGVRFDKYMPHHYAGVAAWRQGQCERAMEYWSNSSNQSALAKVADLQAQQRTGVDTCTAELARRAQPAGDTPATASTAAAPAPAAVPASVEPKPAAPVASVPPAGSTAAPSPAAPRPGAPPANVPPATATATAPPPKPAPAALASAIPAPAALRSLVEQYLGGRYAEVQRSNPAGLPDARARAHGFLLRAAASFTQAQLAGSPPAMLEQARADVRAARSAQAGITPDPGLFSPRFRAFFGETK